jgi:Cd2+/Zn2+-exporting ATPase
MADCPVCELHAESVFKIEGMDCHEEVAILEHRLKTLAGLEGFDADVVGQRLSIQYDAAKLTTARIAEAVAQTGMRAWLEHEEPRPASSSVWRERLVLLSGAFLALGLALQLSSAAPITWLLPYILAVALSGSQTARRAWMSIVLGRLDIHVLMMVAVAGAVVLGEWAEGASVVFLFALAQMLEARAMERARGAIRSLMDLAPAEALVRRDGTERVLPIDAVTLGDIVIVRPGEKIPLDGRVDAGESHVNQAPITGESVPVYKGRGDEVFGGAINGRGALEVAVTRLRRDSTLARIIHLVERAQAQRAPSQTFVDRFARVYTPIVLVLALAVAVLPPLVLGGPESWSTWIYRSLVLLVISCPCALVISTPVSIVSALAAAARKGVLIKGGARLEQLARVRCVAFDKTGTLTRGRLRVTDIVPINGRQPAEILALAASIETRSEHPIGRAIVERATADGLALTRADRVEALPGLGAQGDVAARAVVVGSHRLFEQRGWSGPELDRAMQALAARGRSTVMVAADGEAMGVIGVADEIREGASDTVAMLGRYGIEHVVLLTGDHDLAARALAESVGIADYRSALLPEEKMAAVEALRARYGALAMVGDGVNDAPALAAADVGIAMGVAGTDAALETADVALMADELAKIPYALRLSRATVRNIRINVGFSLALKAAFLVLALTGNATLWMAVLADMGASLIVIGNALRLLRE